MIFKEIFSTFFTSFYLFLGKISGYAWMLFSIGDMMFFYTKNT